MTTDFDNLIRSAKPTVPPTARDGVLDYIEAHGAVALNPGPLRMLLRVAALVVLALASGAVAALFAPKPAAENPEIAELQERADKLKAALPGQDLAGEMQRIENAIAELEAQQAAQDKAMLDAVNDVYRRRDAARMEEWRERHIAHVREHHAREAEATVTALREELALTDAQEQQVRELLKEAEDKAVALIGNYYGKRRHHGMHDRFATLASETQSNLQALLDAQQQERLKGAVIVGSAPEDWAPSEEFRDDTDVDVWMNWMTVSRE